MWKSLFVKKQCIVRVKTEITSVDGLIAKWRRPRTPPRLAKSSRRLDTKDSLLAFLEITGLRTFQKVLNEFICQLYQLEYTQSKHKAKDSTKTCQEFQKVHSCYALVHLNLKHQYCRSKRYSRWRIFTWGMMTTLTAWCEVVGTRRISRPLKSVLLQGKWQSCKGRRFNTPICIFRL